MANRFSAASPVDYVPLDTNLILKAGLTKDAEIQKGVDDFKTKVDYLGNIPTIYDVDFAHKNQYFDNIRTKLQDQIKTNSSFQDPNFKVGLNNIISQASKDPGLWYSQLRTEKGTKIQKEIESNSKISPSYTTVFNSSAKDYSINGNVNSRNMIDIPTPFESVDINSIFSKNFEHIKPNSSAWDDGFKTGSSADTYRILDPTTNKYIQTEGRFNNTGLNNIMNDSNATNQLIFDYKASKNLTFKDNIDSKEFMKYVSDRFDYAKNFDYKETKSGIGYGAKLDLKAAFDQSNQPDNYDTPTYPGAMITENDYIPNINKSLTGGKVTEIEFINNSPVGYLSTTTYLPGSSVPTGKSKFKVTDYDLEKSINDRYENIRMSLQKKVYATGINSSPYYKAWQTFSKGGSNVENKYNSLKGLYSGIVSNAEVLPTGGSINQMELSREIMTSPGVKVSSWKERLDGRGNKVSKQDAIKQFQKSDGSTDYSGIVSFLPADPRNNFEPIFIYTKGEKGVNVGVPENIKQNLSDVTEVYKKLGSGELYEPSLIRYNGEIYAAEWTLNENLQKSSSVYKQDANGQWQAVNISIKDLAQAKIEAELKRNYTDRFGKPEKNKGTAGLDNQNTEPDINQD